jgi:hypothetical protein
MKSKRLLTLIAAFLAFLLQVRAQENPDTSYWSHTGKMGLTFSQVGFSNWASGGDPSVSFNGILNYSFKYEKSPHLWQTVLDAGYGTQRIGNSGNSFKKTDDNLVLMSRYGYRISNKWYASALGSFRTQFTEGYKYEQDSAVFVSNFMSPAYAKLGVGVTYNRNFSENESFSFTFTPLNGKTTIVLDDSLSARGEYGVDPGHKVRFRGGVDLLATLKKELVRNITLNTTVSLFTPYSDLGVMDVNWDLALWFRINEFFSANISTQLVYDQDVKFKNDAGEAYYSAVQFKEVLGIGLTYSF